MPPETLILPLLLAATAPELARLISTAMGHVAVPLSCIRRLFQKWHQAAVSSVKQLADWRRAQARRHIVPTKSVPSAVTSVPETKSIQSNN